MRGPKFQSQSLGSSRVAIWEASTGIVRNVSLRTIGLTPWKKFRSRSRRDNRLSWWQPVDQTRLEDDRLPYHTPVSYIARRDKGARSTNMAHTNRDKKKLLNRVRRIRGQIDAVEAALEAGEECSTVLMTIAACRGAIHGLMAEILEGHIRFHLLDPDGKPTTDQLAAAQELIDVVKTYLK
jgi:FrmR/RcnR family transcriptional regulator, repressor of frmRAB operon